MASSPPVAIINKELSELSLPEPSQSLEFGHDFDESAFNSALDNEALQSTRQFDDNISQKLRSSATRFRYYQPPQPEPPITTSAMRDSFKDFTEALSPPEDDSVSIEMGRGLRRSARSTPSRIQSSELDPNILSILSQDLHSTPRTRPRVTPRKGENIDRSSLRREAQIRRAASLPQSQIEAEVSSSRKTGEHATRRRSTLAQLKAKLDAETDSTFIVDKPTVTVTSRNTRFGNPRSRETSQNFQAMDTGTSMHASHTPQRGTFGTPRSATMTGNATQQSFMLPDLPNLTELVSGAFKDGTPIFSKTSKTRFSRFTSGSFPNPSNGEPPYVPIENLPVPSDEKAIVASLQLLKDKVAQLEQEKADAEKRIDEYEDQVIELRAEIRAQERLRRSDSALGSTDGEGSNKKDSWRTERTKFESTVESLQKRLDRAERKTSVSDIATKRITQERDNLVTQLGVAFYNSEELKNENQALQTENETLRAEVDSLRADSDALRAENETLRLQLARSRAQNDEQTQQLQLNADRKDSAVQKENAALRAELARMRSEYDEDTQRWTRKEAELRSRSTRRDQAELTKITSENSALKAELAEFRAQHDEQSRRWKGKERELSSRIGRRDETIRQLQDLTQLEIDDTLQQENEQLRVQLAHLKENRGDEIQHWIGEVNRLRGLVAYREKQLRELQDAMRDFIKGESVKQPHRAVEASTKHQAVKETETIKKQAESSTRAKSRERSERTTDLAETVQEEIRKTRSASFQCPTTTNLTERSRRVSSQRSISKSRTREDPIDRPASAPQPIIDREQVDALSDAESTTDLSLYRQPPLNGRRHQNTHGVRKINNPAEAASGDVTYLSSMDAEEIATIRRKLEEERAAHRRRIAAPAEARPTKDDTIRSSTSVTSSRPKPMPRKSSMKDLTSKSTATEANVTSHSERQVQDIAYDSQESGPQSKQDTEHSVLKQPNHRRRNAAVEMTSAFILPDITIHSRRVELLATAEVTNGEAHDTKNCTVCRRANCTSNHSASCSDQSHLKQEPIEIPTPIPVSERMPSDIDATLRPSEPPAQALAFVLKQLQDEKNHLILRHRGLVSYLHSHDVSLGKKKRKEIQQQIVDVQKELDAKSDQIYYLYDVVEGVRAGRVMDEEEVEQSLVSIGIDVRDTVAKPKKRVVIDERGLNSDEESDAGGNVESGDEASDEEELPWDGIEESRSLRLPDMDFDESRRLSVY